MIYLENNRQIPVTSPDPYTPITVTRPNQHYAHLLLQDFTSPKGEMTAIYQYLYQNWTVKNHNISETLMRIAQVEMHHLDILGQAITALGGNPKYQSIEKDSHSAWNGNAINYTQNIKQILRYNISLEEGAIHSYQLHAKMIQDQSISAICLRLAEDEEIHRAIFKKLLFELT